MKFALLLLGLVAFLSSEIRAAVALDALGQLLVAHGYGGAQFIAYENTYRLPISCNGKAGDLTIDTGAGVSVIYRQTLKKFGLTSETTDRPVHGAFGKGTEKVAVTNIHALSMGNCTLMNVKADVLTDFNGGAMFRQYGLSDGLFGLREMLRFGAVLDLRDHLLFVHPGGPDKAISGSVRSILTAQGYTPVPLSLVRSFLEVPATVNGTACRFIVDSGAYLTSIDEPFTRRARIGSYDTGLPAHGLGTKARKLRVTHFPELKIGNFTIANAAVAVLDLDAELLQRGTNAEVAGLLGADYLGLDDAIFDFNDLTLYLRRHKKS